MNVGMALGIVLVLIPALIAGAIVLRLFDPTADRRDLIEKRVFDENE
ncbi:MAG: hypothetical protein A07HR60_02572 [uncultured archaeon A07HR60]|nr:MAG: hypothetical protein A07HR60_02572 [uncultured archaeon A07HR60]